MRKIVCLLLSLLFFSSCSAEKNEGIQPNNDEVSVLENENIESEPAPQETAFNEYSVLITVKTINIRSDPSTASKENIVGKVHMGETYTVFDQSKDDDYVEVFGWGGEIDEWDGKNMDIDVKNEFEDDFIDKIEDFLIRLN